MKKGARLVTVIAVAAALLSNTGCQKLKARDQLNKGVAAYKNNNYEQAIEHFKNAINLDADLKTAKLYLATAYAQQYVPGVDTPDNNKNAQQAIEEYQSVLQDDSSNINSLKGIAYLYMNMKKFNDARDYYKKVIAIDPNDPEAYYSVGFIDWSQAYQDASSKKLAAGKSGVEAVLQGKKDEKLCQELQAANGPIIDEGMKMLQTATEKRADYDDAMVYMNLLYLRRANDMSCDDPDARVQDLKMADEWSNKAMDARKKKAEEAAKKNRGGIVLEQPKAQK